MKAVLVAAIAVSLAMAGCAGEPEGTAPTGDPCAGGGTAAGCQPPTPPTPPSVELTGLPAQATAYAQVPFSWSLQNHSVARAHSLLTSVRVSSTSVPDSYLAGPDSFGSEVAKHEHQDLPVTYQGTLQVKRAGTVYVRAYATIGGADYWSAEAAVSIGPVEPTGVVKAVTHTAGAFAGTMEPADQMLQLGDAVVLANDDIVDHVFTFDPPVHDPMSVAGQSDSEPVVFLAPGTVRIMSDDVQPLEATVDVRAPA